MAAKQRDTTDDFDDQFAPDDWAFEASGPSLLARMMAEYAGTFALVLIGVGVALYHSTGDNGTLTIGIAFGLTVAAAIVALGRVSGAHINPAVTVGCWLAGRFSGKDVAPYLLAQVLGGVTAAAVLTSINASAIIVSDPKLFMSSAAIGYGERSPGLFELVPGFTIEVIATALLVAVVLAATSLKANPSLAPFTVGAAITVLVVFAIPFTNGSLNPARATATAVFADDWALQQLWVWWLAGVVAGAAVGLLFRAFGPEEDLIAQGAVEADEV